MVLLVIAGCADPRTAPAPVDEPRASPVGEPSAVIPALSRLRVTFSPADPGWHLRGSAVRLADGIRFAFCCTGAGAVTRSLPALAPGPWELAVDGEVHGDAACPSALYAVVRASGEARPIAEHAVGADAAPTVLAFEQVGARALQLQVFSEGGLHCCGTAYLRGVTLRRPAGAGQLAALTR